MGYPVLSQALRSGAPGQLRIAATTASKIDVRFTVNGRAVDQASEAANG